MKHKRLCVVGVLLMLLLLGTSAARYVVEMEKEAQTPEAVAPTLQEVLTEKVVPDAVLLVAEIVTLLVLLRPSIVAMTGEVGAAATRFGDATRHVQSVGEDGLAVKRSAEEARAAAEAARAEANAMKEELLRLTRAVGLLACGNEQLVQNGTAGKVMEALKKDEA